MARKKGKSSEKIVTDEEFKTLLEFCKRSRQPLEYRFVLISAGRLGLRVGEIAHFKKGWVDRDVKIIKIPEHEPCCCRYCKTSYKLMTKKKKVSDDEVLKHRWNPKTENSARSIYYGFDNEVVEAIESYFDKYDEWPYTYEIVGNRIDRIAKKAQIDTTPHGLRSYCRKCQREHNREYRKARLEKNLCYDCGRPIPTYWDRKRFCPDCYEKRLKKNKQSEKKRVNKGLCRQCGKNPIDYTRSKLHCSECLDKMNE